ncbi:MAG: hypothetical protein IJI14_08905, partial [Anaerolineaceae bacterium]|nr:hypothetical protein [Anaerolineaceae bacterium]
KVRLSISAKVPNCDKRSTCTLSDLRKLHSLVSEVTQIGVQPAPAGCSGGLGMTFATVNPFSRKGSGSSGLNAERRFAAEVGSTRLQSCEASQQNKLNKIRVDFS